MILNNFFDTILFHLAIIRFLSSTLSSIYSNVFFNIQVFDAQLATDLIRIFVEIILVHQLIRRFFRFLESAKYIKFPTRILFLHSSTTFSLIEKPRDWQLLTPSQAVFMIGRCCLLNLRFENFNCPCNKISPFIVPHHAFF